MSGDEGVQFSMTIMQTGLDMGVRMVIAAGRAGGALTAATIRSGYNLVRNAHEQRLTTGKLTLKRLQDVSGGDLHQEQIIDERKIKKLQADLKDRGVNFSIEHARDGNTYLHFAGRDVDTIRHSLHQVMTDHSITQLDTEALSDPADRMVEQQNSSSPDKTSTHIQEQNVTFTPPTNEEAGRLLPALEPTYLADAQGHSVFDAATLERAQNRLDAMTRHSDSVTPETLNQWKQEAQTWEGMNPSFDQKIQNAFPDHPGLTLPHEPDPLISLKSVDTGVTHYDPTARAQAPLGENMTTLNVTESLEPDMTVQIYRGVPANSGSEIQPGDYITTSRELAQHYAGTGTVIEKAIPAAHILDDITEPGGGEYIYRPDQPLLTPTNTKQEKNLDARQRTTVKNTQIQNSEGTNPSSDIGELKNALNDKIRARVAALKGKTNAHLPTQTRRGPTR